MNIWAMAGLIVFIGFQKYVLSLFYVPKRSFEKRQKDRLSTIERTPPGKWRQFLIFSNEWETFGDKYRLFSTIGQMLALIGVAACIVTIWDKF
jgi:hypothetical protein